MKLNEISSGQKVWAVYHREPYEGSDLYGIFSSKAKAKAATKSLADEYTDENHYDIQEIVLDKVYRSSLDLLV